jgi:hypothetical protein
VDDGLFASFSRFGAHYVMPPGTCGHLRWAAPPHQESAFWDAGRHLSFNGPGVDRTVPHHEDYNGELLGSVYVSQFDTRNFAAGAYTIHNGSGGANVGPFQLTFPIAHSSFEWTNKETLAPVRGEDLRLNWRTSGWEGGFVAISGSLLSFRDEPNGYSFGGFTCVERASNEGFTVPAWVVWTARPDAAEVLQLRLTYYTQQEFSAPGLDFGEFTRTLQMESARKPITQTNSGGATNEHPE